jgi:hypothetical protein
LWRSSKNEWFGGTTGFYWGCNNAKDLQVRLETVPALDGAPINVVFHPSDRDRSWLQLFDKKNKAIDIDFGFMAFTTPPLAASHSLDAKFTTTAMAKELATWAKFGPPLGSAWEPTDGERHKFPDMKALVPNDWTVLRVDAPVVNSTAAEKPVDLARMTSDSRIPQEREHAPLWHGTLLPESDADIWLAAAFADYERIVAEGNSIKARAKGGHLSRRNHDQLALGTFVPTSRYLAAVARRGGKDIPLAETRTDLRSDEWYDIAAGKGVLILSELRGLLGESAFERFMDDYGRANAGHRVSTASFFAAAEMAHGKPIGDLKDAWQNGNAPAKLGADVMSRRASGHYWSVDSFERQLDQSLIVYGTVAEIEAQREAAQLLQRKLAARFANIMVPIKADKDVTDRTLKDVHILLIGRPTTNSLTSRLAKSLPIRFNLASFTMAGETFAHPLTAVVAAGPSPLGTDRSVVVFAGLSAEGTWTCPRRFPDRGGAGAEVLLMEVGEPVQRLAIPSSGETPGIAAATAGSR